MSTQLGAVRALLWFSLGWGLLLVLLSFVLPIATASSGYDGAARSRISAFHAYGLVGLLPAMGILAAVILSAGLLAFGRRAPSRTSLSLAEGVAALAFIVLNLAPLVLRLVGLLALPVAISILAAPVTAEVLRQLNRPHQ